MNTPSRRPTSTRKKFSEQFAIPSGGKVNYGYLSEHHGYGETDEEAGEYTEDLAAQMLATTLGIKFDPNVAWKEREQVFKMGNDIVRTQNITQSAIGKPNLWTTVVACAVFIPLENIKEDPKLRQKKSK